MLRWLPVRNPQELVQVSFRSDADAEASDSLSYAMVQAFAREREIFERRGRLQRQYV
jgi:hypothetical protein